MPKSRNRTIEANAMKILSISDVHGSVFAVKHLKRKFEHTKIDAILIHGDFPVTTPPLFVLRYMIFHLSKSRLGYSKWVYGEKYNEFLYYQLKSLRQMIPILKTLTKNIFLIPGNIELPEVINYLKRSFPEITLLHQNVVTFNNLQFAGVGYSLQHVSEYDDDLVCTGELPTKTYNHHVEQLKQELTKKRDESMPLITVSHEFPSFVYKRNDKYKKAGSSALLSLIEEFNPLIHACGHFHEFPLIKKYKNTIIFNPGPLVSYYYGIIEIKINKSNDNKHILRLSFSRLFNSIRDPIAFIYGRRKIYPQPPLWFGR